MKTLKERLEDTVGKSFNYQGKNITIENIKHVQGKHIVFMPNPKPMYDNEAEHFLLALLEVQEKDLKPTQIAVPENKLKVFEPTAENSTIKETLLDTLTKIKESKDYIPQADAICKVVGQMVNIQKTEIQMLKIINSK